MRIAVFLLDPVPAFSVNAEQVADLRARAPEHEFVHCADEATFLRELPSADAAVVWQFDASWYALAPRLKQVHTPAAGRERIAIDPTGRISARFGTFHGRLMAESLLAMVLFVNRRFGRAQEQQSARSWNRDLYLGARRLAGQIALFIGYGAIARHCGKLLRTLGMSIHGVKRDVGSGTQGLDRVFGPQEMSSAVSIADHIVCILPGDRQTDDLLGKELLSVMKPTAAVYNLGRGNAIDASALEQALRNGQIAAAFLDVVPLEPLPASSPLWTTPNLFITPHASAIYAEYLDLYFEELAEVFSKP